MKARSRQSLGFTLIEVLIAFLIIAIGLLGLGALQINTMNDQFEAYQRAQSTALVDEMAARIRINPTAAKSGAYTAQSGAFYGLQTVVDCSAMIGANRDLCEWNTLISGVAVTADVDGDGNADSLAAPLGARGCIELGPVSGSGEVVIRVALAWQGISPSVPPTITCGQNAFGDEGLRRAIYRDVAVK